MIASRAFAYRVDRPEEDIHLLLGHSYDRPLASRKAGTLEITDGDDALTFEADITPEIADTSHGRDALAMIGAGLAIGLSPGFRLPPKRAVPEPEMIEDEGHDPENGAHNAIIRTVLAALLYELSIVTRPAYDEAQVEARSWVRPPQARVFLPSRNRWRA
ncbi:HK97 family phage prohead protease [Roseovarius sp. MBR-154]